MSKLYNRRRGRKANEPRALRYCRRLIGIDDGDAAQHFCGRVAARNRYCDEHDKARFVK